MLGAGLIKLRGDSCWRDLTAMCYHYETQPVPNPLSWRLHHTPLWVHKFETMANHVIELALPFLLILPWHAARTLGGVAQVLFQCTIIASGNLSFLNWLTILPALLCFDDLFLSRFFPSSLPSIEALNQRAWEWTPLLCGREVVNVALLALIIRLSVPVVKNILSPNQMMNTSFDPLKLVNTYGAFGSITRHRDEVILQGTNGDRWDRDAVWKEYEFKVKPGSISRRPAVITPYHYRLDWLMWFLPFSDSRRHPWLYHLVAKLLRNDALATSMIAKNPFEGGEPPRFIRCELYRYEYTKPGSEEAKRGDWWTRKRVGSYMQPMCLDDLTNVCEEMGWPDPKEGISPST
uniref:Lipase maturation factor n=2 Tax=Hemiselmis andersenii TaxID=464988 RepID=A0A7S1DWK6_HEMAN|mmetsp:Transcript_28047/g.68651  ORF Transcript_28047/g.68651 Transcript_28047/m.68651 type:complete len:348 (+) Transcript_28047:17-1060(+)